MRASILTAIMAVGLGAVAAAWFYLWFGMDWDFAGGFALFVAGVCYQALLATMTLAQVIEGMAEEESQ